MNRPARGPLEPVVAVLAKRGRFVVAEPVFEPGDRISLPGKAQVHAADNPKTKRDEALPVALNVLLRKLKS